MIYSRVSASYWSSLGAYWNGLASQTSTRTALGRTRKHYLGVVGRGRTVGYACLIWALGVGRFRTTAEFSTTMTPRLVLLYRFTLCALALLSLEVTGKSLRANCG